MMLRNLEAPANTVKNPDLRILEVLAGNAAHWNKTYSWPSQEKILDLLRRFTGRIMSRRTLNRHLNALQSMCYLRRIRRHRRNHAGQIEMHSTLYTVTARWLGRITRLAHRAVRWTPNPRDPRRPTAVPFMAQYQRVLL
jgi:hypothetical protein